MGGCRCSFRDCPNTTKTENVHFFHYPVKHKERCRIWIENAQKPQFCDLEEDQLRNKVICDHHFEDKWFPNPQKKRLLQGAVPTLLGEYVSEMTYKKEHNNADVPAFIHHDQDIKVLPANDDGTVFVLDTEAMFTKSQKIESYVYKNGKIVPAELQQTVGAVKTPRSYTKVREPKILQKQVQEEYASEGMIKTEFIDSSIVTQPNKVELIENEDEFKPKLTIATDKVGTKRLATPPTLAHKRIATQEIVIPKKIISEESVTIPKQGKNESDLESIYLRKIKQHSRDIASIKKMLQQKVMDEKPSISSVLKVLKEQLPPSLFTIVTLNLDQECDLTEDDVDFFTTIHRLSPEVYQQLTEKFSWNLPSVDVVDNFECE